jgi:hypothetical protein
MKSEEKMALAWVVIIIGLVFLAQCQCVDETATLTEFFANSLSTVHRT